MSRKQDVIAKFKEQFGYEASDLIHAPGRVNLIGDHTDYNDGFVFPAAINFGTDIAAAKRDDKLVRVLALDCNGEFEQFDLADIQFNTDVMWVNYIAGSLQVLMAELGDIQGMDMVVAGNVPQGAGLSSSASLEVAVLKTAAQLNSLTLDGVKAAQLGQKAENQFVGCNCGIMDQLISAMGKIDHAMLLDCRSLTFADAVISKELSIVIINSNVKRGLVDSEYNARRQQCESVAAALGVPALRDVSLAQLEAAKDRLDDTAYRRARHVITEDERAKQFVDALASQNLSLIGELMRGSHNSLKDDFEVTTKELDGIAEIVEGVIKGQGGVRMTGGGFGGCVVALVPSDLADIVTTTVAQQYPQRYGLTPDIYVCTTSTGAFREE